ncbi:hypothetical protein HPP92_028295 [Vanilla planifolia]|uniref:Uncharacterized protein n=1 Tax=Vanilla planifolia TaxID=51239 RepID=A0A835PBJ6_VANPL|nr:hypothetical protein HPP92_028295 [Vanilla planifolia]
MFVPFDSRKGNLLGSTGNTVLPQDTLLAPLENSFIRNKIKSMNRKRTGMDVFQSPGPLHDIVVCWLDQHEIGKGRGFKHLQVFIMELIRIGLFYPTAYVRQLIVSGIVDKNETTFDLERRKRHHKLLKQLPSTCLFDVLDEAKIIEPAFLNEVVQVYSNERRLLLHGSFSSHSSRLVKQNGSYGPLSLPNQKDHPSAYKEGSLTVLMEAVGTLM